MATRTLTTLIADVRSLAAVVNSGFIDDNTELIPWINNAVAELYDLVVGTYEHYYVLNTSFTLAGGQTGNTKDLSALTGGFYKDNTLEKDPGTSNMRVVNKLASFMERAAPLGIQYDIIGTPPALIVYPPELSAGSYKLQYTPDPPVLALASPGPQVDLDATLTRWWPYIQIRAAMDVHRKRGKLDEIIALAGSENDPQPGTLAHMKRRVQTMAHNRSEAPQQVPMRRGRVSPLDPDDMP